MFIYFDSPLVEACCDRDQQRKQNICRRELFQFYKITELFSMIPRHDELKRGTRLAAKSF